MSFAKTIDNGLARGESAVCYFVMLSMIALAFTQAALRNLSNWGVNWAGEWLNELSWADSYLQKGTLWLAFIGGSLATQADRQISIDILSHVVPQRVRHLMRIIVAIAAGVTAFYLARAFFQAVRLNALERPPEFEVLVGTLPFHVCDVAKGQLAAIDETRPAIFCAVRTGFQILRIQIESAGAAFQMIAPVMFCFIAVHRLFRGLAALSELLRHEMAARLGTGAQLPPEI